MCSPVGRGPLRAVPIEGDDGNSDKSTDRANDGGNERANRERQNVPQQPIVGGRQERRSTEDGRNHRRQLSTPTARLKSSLWPRPGRIGLVPIAALVATLVALTLALG